MTVLKRSLIIFFWLIFLVAGFLIIKNTIPYYSLGKDFLFLQSKGELVNNTAWRIAFFMHISGAMVCLIAGLPQFFVSFLRKNRNLHKVLGRIYVIAILGVAAPGGFFMSLFTNGGLPGIVPFFTLAVLWFLTTIWAFKYARARKYMKHMDWMIRSYALTASAVTFRIYHVLFGLVFHIEPVSNYIGSLWLSLIGNLIVGEIIIGIYKKKFPDINSLLNIDKQEAIT